MARIQTAVKMHLQIYTRTSILDKKQKKARREPQAGEAVEAEGSRGDTVAGAGGHQLEVAKVCFLYQIFASYPTSYLIMGNSHGKPVRKKGRLLQRPSFFSGRRGDAEEMDDDGDKSVTTSELRILKVHRRGKREKSAVAVSSSGAEGTATLAKLFGETAAGHDGDSEDSSTNTKPPAQDAPIADAPDVDPDLTAVIPYALPMLPSKQAVRLLKRELRSVLPPRLVWMLNKSENSRGHWTEFARQWFRKEFVRATVGRAEDGSLDVDSKDMNSAVSYCASLVLLLHHAVYLLYICVDLYALSLMSV